MTLSGAINGTLVLIKKGSTPATIVGQGDFTITYGGTPIDVTTKDANGWICTLDGDLATKQVVAAGTLTYNDDAVYEAVKADAFAGTEDDYTIEFAATGETLTGKFIPNAMTDNAAQSTAVTTGISFSSSGVVTRTPQT